MPSPSILVRSNIASKKFIFQIHNKVFGPLKMKIFKRQLRLCTLYCLFMPTNLSRFWERFYNCYIIYLFLLSTSALCLQIIFVLYCRTEDELFEIVIFGLYAISIFVKFVTFHVKHQDLIGILDIIKSEKFALQNETERSIEKFYNKICT